MAVERDLASYVDYALVAVTGALLAWVLSLVFSPQKVSAQRLDDAVKVGTLIEQTNDVRRRFDGSLVWDGLRAGESLYLSDAVYVAADSAATIELGAGGWLLVEERSLVVLHRQIGGLQDAMQVEIVRGGAVGKAGSLALELRAGGTSFDLGEGGAASLRVAGDRSARVSVDKGKARMKGGGAIEAGQRQRLDRKGRGIGAAQRLDIRLTDPAAGGRVYFSGFRAQASFAWKPRRRALKKVVYAFQLSKDPSFENIVKTQKTSKMSVDIEGLAEGAYSWRVTGMKAGKPVRYSAERSVVVVRDRPPVALRPQRDEVVDLSRRHALTLSWSHRGGDAAHKVELARGGALSDPAFERTSKGRVLRIDAKEIDTEGRFCFRVRASRHAAPWCVWRCFRVIRNPRPPPQSFVDR